MTEDTLDMNQIDSELAQEPPPPGACDRFVLRLRHPEEIHSRERSLSPRLQNDSPAFGPDHADLESRESLEQTPRVLLGSTERPDRGMKADQDPGDRQNRRGLGRPGSIPLDRLKRIGGEEGVNPGMIAGMLPEQALVVLRFQPAPPLPEGYAPFVIDERGVVEQMAEPGGACPHAPVVLLPVAPGKGNLVEEADVIESFAGKEHAKTDTRRQVGIPPPALDLNAARPLVE